MKTSLALLGAAALAAGSVLAGPEVSVREHAKELSNQNNVRQGVAPPTQPTSAATATPAAAPPRLSPAIAKLQTDLATIKADSLVTAEQKQKIAEDLTQAAQGAKPSPAVSDKLAANLAAACAEKPLSPTSRARLAQELDAVLNPGKYPQAKLDGIYADVQAVFQENGMKRNAAVAIADDVKALSADIQKGGAK